MNKIPRSFINDLLTRIDIIEVIQSRIQLRKTGNNFSGLCPFHNEKSPSFSASPTKQFYYCFGCGAHGNAISFIMQYDHLGFVDAIENLASSLGLEVPFEGNKAAEDLQAPLFKLLEQANKYYQLQLPKAANAIKYLKENRNLTGVMAKQFNLGYAPPGWDNLLKHLGKNSELLTQLFTAGMLVRKPNGEYYDRFRDRIIFPIRNVRGQIIGFGGRTMGNDTPKYLNSPETPIFHKGSEVYGLYEARQANRELTRIIVAEGYMDVIALAQHGISYAVATLGTAISSKHIQRLFRYTPELIFCFDGDQAGKRAAWRALEATLPMMRDGVQAKFMFLPDQEDPDSLVQKIGQTGFEQAMVQSIPLSDFFFKELGAQSHQDTLAGKALLAKTASAMLNKMPAGVFQQLMYEQLAKFVEMDTDQLKALISDTKPTMPAPKATALHPNKLSPTQLASALLLQQPVLAQYATNHELIKDSRHKDIQILAQVLEFISHNPHINTAGLLEYWREDERLAELAKLAAWELIIPQQGIKEEFLGAWQRVTQSVQEEIIKNLMYKAKQGVISKEEKQRLQRLISEKSSYL